MKSASITTYLILLLIKIIGNGASLFAYVVIVSTLAASPPESFSMVGGEYGYDSSIWWDVFPNVSLVIFLIALITNWKTDRRKWLLISFAIGLLSAIYAIFLLEPIQASVKANALAETVPSDISEQAQTWLQVDLGFQLLSLLSTLILFQPIVKALKK
ncbi:MAG: hypothetical protein MK086_07015 [Flavobacteriales bacterium]|nr:hypothetical protein [Flavobacteriales bacterium]